ncbi:MAG: hypothetical protein WBD13_08560 [Burkholderiaceae bacterium]
MTTQFVSAAQLMSRVLGCDGYRFLTIEHPISSASTEVLQERAKKAALECQSILLGRVP